jgi:hypothetical protein
MGWTTGGGGREHGGTNANSDDGQSPEDIWTWESDMLVAGSEPPAREGNPRRVGMLSGAALLALVMTAGGAVLGPAHGPAGGPATAPVGAASGVGASLGGGSPEWLVPADAVAFAQVDLDPSAGQKVEALRFLARTAVAPAVRDGGGGSGLEDFSGPAVMAELVRGVLESSEALDEVNFSRDVQPWLGGRAAVAFLGEDGGDIEMEIVVQVTDEERARSGLRGLTGKVELDERPGFVVRNGYAILARTQPIAEELSQDAARASLGGEAGYAEDMHGFDDGVASAWVDLGRYETTLAEDSAADDGERVTPIADTGPARAVPATDGEDPVVDPELPAEVRSGLTPRQVRETERLMRQREEEPEAAEELLWDPVWDEARAGARLVVGARFAGGRLKVDGRVSGLKLPQGPAGDLSATLGRLPASTVLGFGLHRPDEMLRHRWVDEAQDVHYSPTVVPSPLSFVEVFGWLEPGKFPGPAARRQLDDMIALAGRNLTVALDAQGLEGGEPSGGMRSVTDPGRAHAAHQRLEALVEAGILAPPAWEEHSEDSDDSDSSAKDQADEADEADSRALADELAAVRRSGDGLVVATDDRYAARLATTGTLDRHPGFAEALPGLDNASAAVWFDVARYAARGGFGEDEDAKAMAEAVGVVGATLRPEGRDGLSFQIRVLPAPAPPVGQASGAGALLPRSASATGHRGADAAAARAVLA